MKSVLSFVFFATASCFADTLDLREHFALAKADGNRYSQIELSRRILDTKPDDAPEIQSALLDLCLEVKDYALAKDTVGHYRETLPPAKVAVATARVLESEGKLADAVEMLKKFLAENPAEPSVSREMVSQCERAKQYVELVKFVDSLSGEKLEKKFLMSRAKAHRALGNYEQAVKDGKAAGYQDDQYSDWARLAKLGTALPYLRRDIPHDDYVALIDDAYWSLYGSLPERALASADAAAKLIPSGVAPVLCRNYAKTGKLSFLDQKGMQLIVQCDKKIAASDTPKNRAKRAAALRAIYQTDLAKEDEQ